MAKHPSEYSADEIDKLKGQKLRIGIGGIDSDRANQYYESYIVMQYLAANPPNWPASIDFKTSEGKVGNFDIEFIKSFELV